MRALPQRPADIDVSVLKDRHTHTHTQDTQDRKKLDYHSTVFLVVYCGNTQDTGENTFN